MPVFVTATEERKTGDSVYETSDHATETGASREARTRSKRTVPSDADFDVARTIFHVDASVSVTCSKPAGSASAGASGDGTRSTIRKPSPPAEDAQSSPRDRSRTPDVTMRPSSVYLRVVDNRLLPTFQTTTSGWVSEVPDVAPRASAAANTANSRKNGASRDFFEPEGHSIATFLPRAAWS